VLVLVKHSLPAIDPALPPAQWRLGEEGRARCRLLAERVRSYDPSSFVSSPEPKAAETARALSDAVAFDERLREHDRAAEPFVSGREFEQAVAAAFERPDEVVYGQESLAAARERFAAAIEEHVAETDGTLVVVAHGTVISAYAGAETGVDAFDLWRMLGLPSLVVLDSTRLVEVVPEL
jgi:broad specificity phosphatase PhoE